MYKVGICGNFCFDSEAVGGQTIRTRIVAEELKKGFGENEIFCIDTNGWKKNPITLFVKCVKLAIQCENIIILPAHNGIKIFIPLFLLLTTLFKKRLHYIVIGGWITDSLSGNKWLLYFTSKINFIYVQTKILKEKLNKVGISKNVYVFPNFKLFEPIDQDEVGNEYTLPYKSCILSRINYMKGIEDAINAINSINMKYGRKMMTLDIYGPIENEYEEHFYKIINEYSSFVSYKGIIDYNKTIDVLKEYYILLFPTKYYTEGFPGTILDAFFGGVPVLASRWESHRDIIEENITGITYEFGNCKDFHDKLNYIISNPDKVIEMKSNCLKESRKYTSDYVMKILFDKLQ